MCEACSGSGSDTGAVRRRAHLGDLVAYRLPLPHEIDAEVDVRLLVTHVKALLLLDEALGQQIVRDPPQLLLADRPLLGPRFRARLVAAAQNVLQHRDANICDQCSTQAAEAEIESLQRWHGRKANRQARPHPVPSTHSGSAEWFCRRCKTPLGQRRKSAQCADPGARAG